MTSTLADVWDSMRRPWPSVVYVETVNYCNANCVSCLNDRIVRKRRVMPDDEFRAVADKVKARGLKIGAMFCFGEPLMDRTLEAKFAYANSIGVLAPHVGLNTNVHYLTPERWDGLLAHTPNIILSFFNVGSEFERLTGGLSWDRCYKNAREFIEYRDRKCPGYPIFISVNKIEGHSLENVQKAFAGYRVTYVQDAELRYYGGARIEGVVDRMIMYRDWRCDGFKGALQVKPDLGAEFCAYDIPAGQTRFGHFLEDSWGELHDKFRQKWRRGCSLCLRCDYWHLAKRVIANGFQPVDDPSWKEGL